VCCVMCVVCWVGNSGEKDPGLYGPCYRMLCDCCSMGWRGVGMVAHMKVLVREGVGMMPFVDLIYR
jgi:hypothetical protein